VRGCMRWRGRFHDEGATSEPPVLCVKCAADDRVGSTDRRWNEPVADRCGQIATRIGQSRGAPCHSSEVHGAGQAPRPCSRWRSSLLTIVGTISRPCTRLLHGADPSVAPAAVDCRARRARSPRPRSRERNEDAARSRTLRATFPQNARTSPRPMRSAVHLVSTR